MQLYTVGRAEFADANGFCRGALSTESAAEFLLSEAYPNRDCGAWWQPWELWRLRPYTLGRAESADADGFCRRALSTESAAVFLSSEAYPHRDCGQWWPL